MNNDETISQKFLEDFIKEKLGSGTRKYLTMGSVTPSKTEAPNLDNLPAPV